MFEQSIEIVLMYILEGLKINTNINMSNVTSWPVSKIRSQYAVVQTSH